MAVVSCPKCTAGLRVPDGSTAAVRCPKCSTVFQPPKGKAAAPAFEVVEEAPPKPAPRPAARPAPPPPPAAPKKAFSLDDAVRSADKAPPRRDDRDEDDDRDRDRGRRRRDEDDEDDRPRSRSRRDDDDDRDRDRDRDRRRRDDDDDYDDRDRDRDRPRKKSPFGIARPAVLLILISLGLYFGGIALHALFLFLAWVGAVIPNGLVLVTGLLGLVGWVVALVGLGMSIAGPPKARGLAIGTTAVAFVHLILAFVVATNEKSGSFGGGSSIAMLSASNRIERLQDIEAELRKEQMNNPTGQRVKDLLAERSDAGGRIGGGDDGAIRWNDLVTDLPRLDALIAVLVYSSRGFEYYLLSLFAGLFELARLILLGLLLGSLARAAKDHRAESASTFGWIAGAAAVGIAMLVLVLAAVLARSAAEAAVKGLTQPQFTPGADMQVEIERYNKRLRSIQRAPLHWVAGSELLVYTLHAGALVMPSLAAFGIWKSMARRR